MTDNNQPKQVPPPCHQKLPHQYERIVLDGEKAGQPETVHSFLVKLHHIPNLRDYSRQYQGWVVLEAPVCLTEDTYPSFMLWNLLAQFKEVNPPKCGHCGEAELQPDAEPMVWVDPDTDLSELALLYGNQGLVFDVEPSPVSRDFASQLVREGAPCFRVLHDGDEIGDMIGKHSTLVTALMNNYHDVLAERYGPDLKSDSRTH